MPAVAIQPYQYIAGPSLALAVALLGALTHQAMSVLTPVRQPAEGANFVTGFRMVPVKGLSRRVCVLWIVTFSSTPIYIKYRIYIRKPIEQRRLLEDAALLRMKEHLATIGLGLLPIYWYLGRIPRTRRPTARVMGNRYIAGRAGSFSWSVTSSTTSGVSDH